ncbi:uncharacterized protein ACOB8E_004177 isoform 1-T1 [Sarcophilus harrisii]
MQGKKVVPCIAAILASAGKRCPFLRVIKEIWGRETAVNANFPSAPQPRAPKASAGQLLHNSDQFLVPGFIFKSTPAAILGELQLKLSSNLGLPSLSVSASLFDGSLVQV